MSLQPIEVPDSIRNLAIPDPATELIDAANEQIEAFMLADQNVIENFVTCDFHLVAQALIWIEQNGLRAGNRFCELGSGVGVAAMLAALPEPFGHLQSIGIEIEPSLVEQANQIATQQNSDAEFYCGSFVPRASIDTSQLDREIENVVTESGDVFDEVGLAIDDFDLFFAYPWPGESSFFEAVVDQCAAVGALLLTYGGREGMQLVRKTD
jgi:tRNA G46 methylase TrmB